MKNFNSLSFSHLGLFVSDIHQMKSFYTRVLGLYVTDEGPFPDGQYLVFLSKDPEEHHQVVLVEGRPPSLDFNSINQVSFFVDDLQQLKDFYKSVLEMGVEDLQCVTHGNAWSVYFRDPEGNRIEVYTHTPWYIRQPFREPLDLNLDIEKIQRETELFCREQPGFMSRQQWLQSMNSLMKESD